jgi:hypothetical protein
VAWVWPVRHGWWVGCVGWVRELMRWGTGGWMVRHRTGALGREGVVSEDEREEAGDARGEAVKGAEV